MFTSLYSFWPQLGDLSFTCSSFYCASQASSSDLITSECTTTTSKITTTTTLRNASVWPNSALCGRADGRTAGPEGTAAWPKIWAPLPLLPLYPSMMTITPLHSLLLFSPHWPSKLHLCTPPPAPSTPPQSIWIPQWGLFVWGLPLHCAATGSRVNGQANEFSPAADCGAHSMRKHTVPSRSSFLQNLVPVKAV